MGETIRITMPCPAAFEEPDPLRRQQLIYICYLAHVAITWAAYKLKWRSEIAKGAAVCILVFSSFCLALCIAIAIYNMAALVGFFVPEMSWLQPLPFWFAVGAPFATLIHIPIASWWARWGFKWVVGL